MRKYTILPPNPSTGRRKPKYLPRLLRPDPSGIASHRNGTVLFLGNIYVESVGNGVTRTRITIGHPGPGQLDFGSVEIDWVQNGQSEYNVVVRISSSGESVVDGGVQLRVGMEGVARDTHASDNVYSRASLQCSQPV